MSEVKRYNVIADKYGDGTVEESESGSVVFYEDYAALKERFDFKQNLTEQIVELKAQRDALAAENAARGEIIERLMGQYSAAGYHAVQNSLNPAQSLLYDAMQVLKQPATAAYLNSVRAEGVDKAVAHLHKKFEGTGHIGVPVMALESLAAKLRAGKDGE